MSKLPLNKEFSKNESSLKLNRKSEVFDSMSGFTKVSFVNKHFIILSWYFKIRCKTICFMMTSKRNSCVSFALSYTHLKMYGKGIKMDEFREIATIATSFDISRLNVVIAFRFSEHLWHTLDHTWVKFQWFQLRRNWITCC